MEHGHLARGQVQISDSPNYVWYCPNTTRCLETWFKIGLFFYFILMILKFYNLQWQHVFSPFLNSKQIVTKQNRSLTLKLHNKKGQVGLRNLGTITVHAEETIASRNAVEIAFRCSHLDNKDLFSKSVSTRGIYCMEVYFQR